MSALFRPPFRLRYTHATRCAMWQGDVLTKSYFMLFFFNDTLRPLRNWSASLSRYRDPGSAGESLTLRDYSHGPDRAENEGFSFLRHLPFLGTYMLSRELESFLTSHSAFACGAGASSHRGLLHSVMLTKSYDLALCATSIYFSGEPSQPV
jgi:hypothetical protein